MLTLNYVNDPEFVHQQIQEKIFKFDTPKDRRNLLIFSLSFYVGLSAAQVSELDYENIDTENKIINSYSRKLKKYIEYKLDEKTLDILKVYIEKDFHNKSGRLLLASVKSGSLLNKNMTIRAVQDKIKTYQPIVGNYKSFRRFTKKKICNPENRDFNFLCNLLKLSARKRKLEFSLSDEQIKLLIQSNCFYCNCPPNNNLRNPHTKTGFSWSGIDRVDSSKGYVIENVVSCCSICNHMKMNLSQSEFLKKIYSIAKHMQKSAISF